MKRVVYFSGLFLAFLLCACSNDSDDSELSADVSVNSEVAITTSIEDLPAEYKELLSKATPYISPQMQDIINSIDTS